MGEKMSLERVRDGLRKMEPEGEWWSPDSGMTHWTVPIKAWADAIDAHLTQPAQAVDVGAIREVVFWLTSNSHWISGAYEQGRKLTAALPNGKEG